MPLIVPRTFTPPVAGGVQVRGTINQSHRESAKCPNPFLQIQLCMYVRVEKFQLHTVVFSASAMK